MDTEATLQQGLGAWPAVPLPLLQRLEREFPHRCAKPGEALDEIHHYAGMRAMVDRLWEIYREQMNTQMGT